MDSISLQPFTKEEWRTHQDQSIEKTRKTKVRLQAVDGRGNPVVGAKMAVTLAKRSFPFGAVISDYILQNTTFQNWFTSRFLAALSTIWNAGHVFISDLIDTMFRPKIQSKSTVFRCCLIKSVTVKIAFYKNLEGKNSCSKHIMFWLCLGC